MLLHNMGLCHAAIDSENSLRNTFFSRKSVLRQESQKIENYILCSAQAQSHIGSDNCNGISNVSKDMHTNFMTHAAVLLLKHFNSKVGNYFCTILYFILPTLRFLCRRSDMKPGDRRKFADLSEATCFRSSPTGWLARNALYALSLSLSLSLLRSYQYFFVCGFIHFFCLCWLVFLMFWSN